jgi:concanavalin A-like lectin/glucanase superfamily protein
LSSYFATIRRTKDAHQYIQEFTRQFALYKATQDQVDNPTYKTFNRASSNRLICKEIAAKPLLQSVEFYLPTVPIEPGPPDGPSPTGTVTVMLNFDQELEDRSNNKNDALFEFTNNQLVFSSGRDSMMSFAVNFNQSSNSTYDKLWIPFSNSTQIVYDTPNGFSLFMRYKPHTLTNLGTATSAPQPAPMTNRIRYLGGPVLNKYNVGIYNIWWGSAWNSGNAASDRGSLQSSYNTIVNSDHYKPMWQYGGIKTPVISNNNVIHTATPLPSASNVTFLEINEMIDACVAAGQVPDYRSFGEPAMALNTMDYRHLYVVHLPPNKFLPVGYNGASAVALSTTPPHLVWYNWSALNYATNHLNQSMFPQYSYRQMAAQAWAHEVFHHLESPWPGGCTSDQQGYTGYVYNYQGECAGIQHSSSGAGTRLKALSGTSVITESIWSDMDGAAVAAGSGDNWTRQPAATTGNTIRRYLWQKLDDLDNGATAAVGEDGTIYFNVKKAGVEYKRKTTPGAMKVTEWADCWFNFNYATNTPTIYVNNVPYTNASTEALLWNNKHSHFIIANYDLGAVTGQFRGLLDDMRLYRNQVTTAEEVNNLSTNGLTITGVNIDATQGVAIVNRCKIGTKLDNLVFVPADVEPGDVAPTGPASFTGISFTSTSFTI